MVAIGYFEIGIYHPKNETNIGTLWRSAQQLGAAGIFTIGRRYRKQSSDTCKTHKHIPLRHYLDFDEFYANLPYNARLVGVEMGSTPIESAGHPPSGIYLLGAEDHGLPQDILDRCHQVISLNSVNGNSYNVSVAGSIVMYDRVFPRAIQKPILFGKVWNYNTGKQMLHWVPKEPVQ